MTTNRLTSRVGVVGGLFLTLLSVSCAGDPERAPNPISPSAAVVARPAGALPQANLEGAEIQSAETDDLAEAGDAAAAALTLSGNWTGTVTSIGGNPKPQTMKLTIKFTHTGTRLTGVFKFPPEDGVVGVLTFDLQQTSTSSTKRTFSGKMRTVFKGDKCSPATSPGSLVATTAGKPMTLVGTFKGIAAGCHMETDKFSLKKL